MDAGPLTHIREHWKRAVQASDDSYVAEVVSAALKLFHDGVARTIPLNSTALLEILLISVVGLERTGTPGLDEITSSAVIAIVSRDSDGSLKALSKNIRQVLCAELFPVTVPWIGPAVLKALITISATVVALGTGDAAGQFDVSLATLELGQRFATDYRNVRILREAYASAAQCYREQGDSQRASMAECRALDLHERMVHAHPHGALGIRFVRHPSSHRDQKVVMLNLFDEKSCQVAPSEMRRDLCVITDKALMRRLNPLQEALALGADYLRSLETESEHSPPKGTTSVAVAPPAELPLQVVKPLLQAVEEVRTRGLYRELENLHASCDLSESRLLELNGLTDSELEFGSDFTDEVRLHRLNLYQNAIALRLKRGLIDETFLRLNFMVTAFLGFGQVDETNAWARCLYEIREHVTRLFPIREPGIRFLQTRHGILTVIGHLCSEIDVWVKMGMLNLRPQYHGVLIAENRKSANQACQKYLRRHLCVVTDPRLCKRFSRYQHILEYETYTLFGIADRPLLNSDALAAMQPQLNRRGVTSIVNLSAYDRARGFELLHDWGVPEDAWFVAFHVRENRDECSANSVHRNAKIESYLKVIEEITRRGGWVIRMGDPSMTPLPQMPQVIDYACSDLRADWMDIFCMAVSRFCVGTASGLNGLALVLGTPFVGTNLSPIASWPILEQDRFIPKLLWSEREKRLLTFRECCRFPFGKLFHTHLYEQLGVKIIDNTTEEIMEVVTEMLELVEHSYPYTDEDERLQQRFKVIVEQVEGFQPCGRLGRNFLRNYAALLD